MRVHTRFGAMILAAALGFGVTACGTDDGAGVRVLDEGDGSASGSASGPASGAASGSASASTES